MARHGIRRLIMTAVATAALVASVAGCADDDTPSGAASRAESAASSLASEAGDALASATAEAGRRLDEFKNGVDAKDDVKLGDVTTDSDDRSTVEVTVTNSASSTRSYAVQVDFRDQDGNRLDTVVVTVDDVKAGTAKDATARSTRTLSGDVTASVARAVRN